MAPLVRAVAFEAALEAFVQIRINVDGSENVNVRGPRLLCRVGEPTVVISLVVREIVRCVAGLTPHPKDVLEVAATDAVVRVLLVQKDPVVQVHFAECHWPFLLVHHVGLKSQRGR
jgi:hypothetical protein